MSCRGIVGFRTCRVNGTVVLAIGPARSTRTQLLIHPRCSLSMVYAFFRVTATKETVSGIPPVRFVGRPPDVHPIVKVPAVMLPVPMYQDVPSRVPEGIATPLPLFL